jgi:hypothetical protein
MSYSEKYKVMDLNGYTKVLCSDNRYNKELNDGQGGYELVVAIRAPEDVK